MRFQQIYLISVCISSSILMMGTDQCVEKIHCEAQDIILN